MSQPFVETSSVPNLEKEELPKIPVQQERLTIVAFTDETLGKPRENGVYSAFYNPKDFSANYGIKYADPKVGSNGIDTHDMKFIKKDPISFNFSLKLDGTGAAIPAGDRLRGRIMNVDDEIEEFLHTVYETHGDIHRPSYLIISWGSALTAAVVLSSLSVRKTLFSADGRTLRADLECGFLEFEGKEKAVARLQLQSPDMTHLRTVQQGDKLPLMCERIYGDAKLYLEVARFNGLTNYRSLQPGQQLYFPPLIASKS